MLPLLQMPHGGLYLGLIIAGAVTVVTLAIVLPLTLSKKKGEGDEAAAPVAVAATMDFQGDLGTAATESGHVRRARLALPADTLPATMGGFTDSSLPTVIAWVTVKAKAASADITSPTATIHTYTPTDSDVADPLPIDAPLYNVPTLLRRYADGQVGVAVPSALSMRWAALVKAGTVAIGDSVELELHFRVAVLAADTTAEERTAAAVALRAGNEGADFISTASLNAVVPTWAPMLTGGKDAPDHASLRKTAVLRSSDSGMDTPVAGTVEVAAADLITAGQLQDATWDTGGTPTKWSALFSNTDESLALQFAGVPAPYILAVPDPAFHVLATMTLHNDADGTSHALGHGDPELLMSFVDDRAGNVRNYDLFGSTRLFDHAANNGQRVAPKPSDNVARVVAGTFTLSPNPTLDQYTRLHIALYAVPGGTELTTDTQRNVKHRTYSGLTEHIVNIDASNNLPTLTRAGTRPLGVVDVKIPA